jgi:hypothetical protein
MREPTLSIDRRSKQWALFDGFDLVEGFFPYRNEDEAISLGRAAAAKRTDLTPQVVYSDATITSIRVVKPREKTGSGTLQFHPIG